MIPDEVNIHSEDNPEDFEIFKQMHVPFEKDEKELWQSLEKQLKQPKVIRFTLVYRAIAASLLIAVSLTVFCYSYQESLQCLKGQNLNYSLPDGSKVYLNADSKLSYAPYWWYFSRDVQLEGEAFFEVQKGSTFAVKSFNGRTEVLGTSFNIQSRQGRYQVHCLTGKVKVIAQNEVLLLKNQKAILKGQTLDKLENVAYEASMSWRKAQFYFKDAPLSYVCKEIGRYYDVEISAIPSLLYSGSFSKDMPIEDALNLICLPFNLKFEPISKNRFKIIE